MSYEVTCVRCGGISMRHTSSDKPAMCGHEHHNECDCVCGWCRTGTPWPPPILDASGRFLTSDPHQAPAVRPQGPWNHNTTGE